MEQIWLYLQKYSKLDTDINSTKKLALKAVYEVTGIELEENKLSFEKGKIKVKVTGALKTELFLKREKINEIFSQSIQNLEKFSIE